MDDRRTLHTILPEQSASPPAYPSSTPLAFQPFSPVVPTAPPPATQAAPPQSLSLPLPTPPVYDPAVLRSPWSQPHSIGTTPSVSGRDEPPPRGLGVRAENQSMSEVSALTQGVQGLSLESSEDGDRERAEMRRSQGSQGSRGDGRGDGRRPHPQQRGQTMPYGMSNPAVGPSDPYGGTTSPIYSNMPGVYGQPQPMQFAPRGYSPTYPSAMHVMMGPQGVGHYPTYSQSFSIPALVAPDHSVTPGMMGITSPVAFGTQGQSPLVSSTYPFQQRTSPDVPGAGGPSSHYTQQGRPAQRPHYPPSSFHYPPSTSPTQPQGARQQPQYSPIYTTGPSGSSHLAYSPMSFQSPTSPIFQPPRYGYQPQHHQQPSPDEGGGTGIRAGGGTWYYVPDQGQPHQHQHQTQQIQGYDQAQQVQVPMQGGYPQTYGLGFMASPIQRMEGGDTHGGSIPAQAPLSPLLFPTVPTHSSHPPRFSPRPAPSQSLSSSITTAPTAADPHAPSPPIPGPEETGFREQVSQIPFPSISPSNRPPPRRPPTPTRRPYHPNPPQNRSEWVMWVGNVPHDATHDELWRYFNQPIYVPRGGLAQSQSHAQPPGEDDSGGVSSVFLISRSNCAFVNFNSEGHLSRAVAYFNGKPIRPNDVRCPRLVCRVRRRDDDLRAGVGGQRGMGMHTRWVKEQEREKEEEMRRNRMMMGGGGEGEEGEQGSGSGMGAIVPTRTLGHSGSSGSFASTNSSFLAKNFPKRYFILKSLTQFDLNISVEKGLWATQTHNEPILDQAYRTSQDVYLIFSANKSGEFYGYARMNGPITSRTENRVSWASRTESDRSSKSLESPVQKRPPQGPEMIAEDAEGEEQENDKVSPEVEVKIEEQEQPEIEQSLFDDPPVAEGEQGEEQQGEEQQGEEQQGKEMNAEQSDGEEPEEPTRRGSLLSPPATGIARSPSPMTDDEAEPLKQLEASRERPVHRPHIRSSGRPRDKPPLPGGQGGSGGDGLGFTPQVSGDDVQPPQPQVVTSAPAEVGPERHKFTFDEPEPHNTVDSSQLGGSGLAAILASRSPEFELRLESLASRQAERGSSGQEGEEDGDGVIRKDTAPTQEEIEERERDHSSRDNSSKSRSGENSGQSQTVGNRAEGEPVRDDDDGEEDDGAEQGPPEAGPEGSPATPEKQQHQQQGPEGEGWGTPFKVEWLKVEPLPFHRTRHLRNPWNNEREVKVSRDGTEVEPAIGALLLEEWERTDIESAPSMTPATVSRRQGSRPPFRAGYSAPGNPNPAVPLSPYSSVREGGVPQWLFDRGNPPWQNS